MSNNKELQQGLAHVRAIAFYLPQFYPTQENDEWWEPGFTEWTNVARAKPLFRGHYQPRIPRDLGFYDLRVPETREKQAKYAREAGIEGFCYWHYWFGNGKRLLDRVFRDVVESGKPNYPFCLCWANHSWYAKTWDPNKPNKLLIEQTYPGVEDYIAHFMEMLPAFKDERYMKVNGKLIFGLYAPIDIPDFDVFKETWNKLAIENGLNGFYFFGFTFDKNKVEQIFNLGFDTCVYDGVMSKLSNISLFQRLKRKISHIPLITEYQDYVDNYLAELNCLDNVHACINPNFDHSPRSSYKGVILNNSTPNKWANLCSKAIEFSIKKHIGDENIVFIKAWNEWGEGNYLEPDSKYGIEYIHALKKVLDTDKK